VKTCSWQSWKAWMIRKNELPTWLQAFAAHSRFNIIVPSSFHRCEHIGCLFTVIFHQFAPYLTCNLNLFQEVNVAYCSLRSISNLWTPGDQCCVTVNNNPLFTICDFTQSRQAGGHSHDNVWAHRQICKQILRI
jgi:hypothetical protein